MSFSDLFNSFEVYAFRLEGLGHYSTPESDQRFAVYQRGEQTPLESYADWANTISSAGKRGARMERLRLTSTPPTLYERFEIEAGYRAGVLAGEDIRTLPYSGPRDQDFWAFDDKYFMVMNYAEDGEFLDFDVLDMTPELLSRVNHWKSRYYNEGTRVSFD